MPIAETCERIADCWVCRSSSGFDSISTHAEEARNPQRDVPIGILISLLLCTILYMAVAAVITGMVPYPNIDIS